MVPVWRDRVRDTQEQLRLLPRSEGLAHLDEQRDLVDR